MTHATYARRTLLCTLLLLAVAAVWGAPTPAGTIIRNQANAFVNGTTYLSNEVDTLIRAVCSPNLTPNGAPDAPGQRTSVSAGSPTYLPYTLTNTGNDRFTFDLSVVLGTGDWTPTNTVLYRDTNRNARLDAGETPVSAVTLESDSSLSLILEVTTPIDGTGDRALSPVATCRNADGSSGAEDDQNYALVQIVQGPALQLFKTVSKRQFAPGEEVSFDVRLLNNGSQSAVNPVLTDDFDLSDLDGLTFVSGSATATRGTLEYSDGTTWTETEPSTVRGVRLGLPTLEAGGEVILSFRLRVLSDAEAGTRQNRAVVLADSSGPGGSAEVSADFDIRANYAHFLGPDGNPRALSGGEGSADDTQSKGRLIYGQTDCFIHTLENASTLPDRFDLTFNGLPNGVTATLNSAEANAGNEPLSNTFELRAGERRDFKLCLNVTELVSPFTVTLTATSLATGASNLTYDRVEEVVAAGAELELTKSADPSGSVAEGGLLTYTLEITNNHDFNLNDVRISDTLQAFEDSDGEATDLSPPTFVSASEGGDYDAGTRTVSWRVPQIAAGESVTFTVQVRMPTEVPDATRFVLRNRFSVAAQELPEPKLSNEVTHAFPLLTLNIEKSVEETTVRIGDALHYTVTVSNPNEVPINLTIVDTPPERTTYVAGSAVVESGTNKRALEPEQRGNELVWDLKDDPDFRLEPRGSADGRDEVSVRYALTVNPGASSPLQNTAYALGLFGSGDGAASGVVISSEEVNVNVELIERVFNQPDALLSGRVYLDVNENHTYDHGLDLPLPGARLLLPNGWQTLTDAEGRYTFRDLTPGAWSLTLDASSAPFAPLPHPEGLRGGYQHRLVLQGLTVSDFPLVAPAGTIRAFRQTTLRFGPLEVEKRLIALPEGVRVVLHLTATEPLPDLIVSDPVPNTEARRFTFETFEGEQTLTYDLETQPGEPINLTDPNARWRYP